MTTIQMSTEQAARYDNGNDSDPIMSELAELLAPYEEAGQGAEVVHPDGFVVLATR